MQRGLDPRSQVGGGSHTSWPQGVEQKSESRGERRKWGRDFRVASQGNISLHLVCHGERTTTEVVTQNKENRHTGLRLPPRTDRKAPGRRVQSTSGSKGVSRKRRNAIVGDKTLA